ncbi:unnamed protein product [Brachionus calyciflorus]|uniref:General transcription factor 3C polypeptide 3 n=1 Tax=Brachionus calyciflorus TaxID=104777 RepID=A0A814G125_9BILA|nr:unnamed protein product [Brachionus calyciflorus]
MDFGLSENASNIDIFTLNNANNQHAGEITFQEYETLIENQHFRNELMLNQSGLIDATTEITTTLPSTSTETQTQQQQHKFKTKSSQLNSSNLDEYIEDFDDTSQWNDFDIETLNFDKFLKDHQINNLNQSEIENEGVQDSSKKPIKRKKEENEDPVELKAKRRRNRVLPIEIQGLMGEANLAYARGDTNKAIDACLEVIKYAPKASEPFQLLALLYSEMGQNDKALRVGLIAAQLNKDPDEWIQLIQQAVMEGDVDLILFCYNNAIQCDPKNTQLHLERVKLLHEKKDMRRLVLAKLMLLKYVDIEKDYDVYETYFDQLMNELNSGDNSDRNKKIYILKNDLKKFGLNCKTERLIMLINLMIEQKSFKESIMIIFSHCQIRVKNKNQESCSDIPISTCTFSQFESFQCLNDYIFEVPSTCHNYIKTQFIVCLINLDYDSEEYLIEEILKNDIATCSSELFLLANTYYAKKDWSKAKKFFLLLLTNVAEYLVQLEVWLKYGNCCSYLEEIEEAINAYRNAVNLDRSNCEAALSLVNILKKNALLYEEASNVIENTLNTKKSQSLNTDILNLMINECLIQYEQKNYVKFIVNSRNLIFGNFSYVLEQDNITQLLRTDSRAQRAFIFHQILDENDFDITFNYNKLNYHIQNSIFDVYLKLCKTLVHLKRHNELLIYSVGATVLPMVYERMDWNKSINFTCLIACILKRDGNNAFNILKDFILEFKNSNKLWSYVGIVIGLCPSLSQQKFFIRLGAKYMDHLPLCMINAHFAIMSGTYRYALVEYMNCFKQNPFDPFINLIIAITYCHISCQKYNTKRHLLVSQSLVFLRRYIKFRGICQETYYNIARIMHQLSLFDLAAYYYRKCLDVSCTFPQQKEIYDLTRYAAYNLISIYKLSGSHELARQTMKEYLSF